MKFIQIAVLPGVYGATVYALGKDGRVYVKEGGTDYWYTLTTIVKEKSKSA